MKPVSLEFFDDVPAVLSYVTSELVETLHDDADDCERSRDLAQANELRAKIDDIEAVSPLIEAAPDLLSTLEFLADQWADEFDNDKPISGADFVQWFGECRRLHILPTIAKARNA